MSFLENIPIKLNIKEVIRDLHLNEKTSSSVNFHELLNTTESLIQPKASYEAVYINNKGEDTVEIDGITFSSRVLRMNLENVERVFPYLITIGGDLEDEASSFEDVLMQFYLENMGDMVLRLCKKHLEKHLKKHYGLEKLASMSPGSLENWPVTEQEPLFSLFQEEQDKVGVRLTESMLMIPRKSISGIIFPTEVTFFSCQLCPRERCSARKAPYDERLKKKYGLVDE